MTKVKSAFADPANPWANKVYKQRDLKSALLFEASLLYCSCGWFYDSFLFFQTICSQAKLRDFDFCRDIEALVELKKMKICFPLPVFVP
jgi:uncharacterized protein YjbI with pentapeptide repeats